MIRSLHHSMPASARGFTLLELIIVMVIIGIMVAITLPRLSSSDNRRFELAVEQTADLLLMYAQRESSSQSPIGLEFNPAENALRILRLENASNDIESVQAEWFMDPNVKSVFLPDDLIDSRRVQIRADGEPVDTRQWPLTNDVGQDRPEIEIVLPGPRENVVLVLTPYAIAPYRRGVEWQAVAREAIDLDAEGRDREDW